MNSGIQIWLSMQVTYIINLNVAYCSIFIAHLFQGVPGYYIFFIIFLGTFDMDTCLNACYLKCTEYLKYSTKWNHLQKWDIYSIWNCISCLDRRTSSACCFFSPNLLHNPNWIQKKFNICYYPSLHSSICAV